MREAQGLLSKLDLEILDYILDNYTLLQGAMLLVGLNTDYPGGLRHHALDYKISYRQHVYFEQ